MSLGKWSMASLNRVGNESPATFAFISALVGYVAIIVCLYVWCDVRWQLLLSVVSLYMTFVICRRIPSADGATLSLFGSIGVVLLVYTLLGLDDVGFLMITIGWIAGLIMAFNGPDIFNRKFKISFVLTLCFICALASLAVIRLFRSHTAGLM
jgi:hypothetical protein